MVLRASFLVVLDFRVKSSIHVSYGRVGFDGVDMIVWVWLHINYFGDHGVVVLVWVFFMTYVAFWIRW